MSTFKEYFEKLYCNSPVPTAILGFYDLPLYSNAPFQSWMQRTRISGLGSLPLTVWKGQERCLRDHAGVIVEVTMNGTKQSFQFIPHQFEGQDYAVLTVVNAPPFLPDDKKTVDLLRHAQTKINLYLNGIWGVAEMRGMRSKCYKPLTTEVQRIMRAINHVNRLMDGQQLEYYTLTLDVGAFAACVVKIVQKIIPGINLQLEIPSEKLFAEMMPEDTEMVLATMLSNAFRYGEDLVTVRVDRHEGKVRLTVEDDGPGMIDPKRLTEWGYHTADKTGYNGMGFALTMSRQLLERQGASLEYERAEGHTRFHIIMDEKPDPRLGRLAEWRTEPKENMLSQIRIELSDCIYQIERKMKK